MDVIIFWVLLALIILAGHLWLWRRRRRSQQSRTVVEEKNTQSRYLTNESREFHIPLSAIRALVRELQVQRTRKRQPQKVILEIPGKQDYFVRRVRKDILANLDDPDYSVEALGHHIGMSSSQLNRKLRAITGMTTTHFIRIVRLRKAQELLRDSRLTITSVALDTGYQDPGYFARIFRKETGLSPGEWREQNAFSEGKE